MTSVPEMPIGARPSKVAFPGVGSITARYEAAPPEHNLNRSAIARVKQIGWNTRRSAIAPIAGCHPTSY
jgi:hypothetical protein